MFSKLPLRVSILVAAVLPFGVLAIPHGPLVDVEARAEESLNLTKRYSGTKWSFYNVETGNQ